ncbi:hypothetical protein CBS101457_002101 [Exobasidium rhododendri]|nr:hypothetical protein CBS101457_002101 [Exobasidium rhododendri]
MSMNQKGRPASARGSRIKGPKKPGLKIPLEEMWDRLAKGINHIQNHNISNLSYEEHYRYAYNLVLYQNGDVLYSGTKRQIEEHLVRLCAEKIVPAFPPGGATSAPSNIVLPDQLLMVENAAVSSSKGKGKAPVRGDVKQEEDLDQDAGVNGLSMTAIQGGDRADAVAKTQAGERFLKAIRDTWDDHCACMSKVRDVLKYVDKVYVEPAKVLPIWDLGLELFRDTVLRSNKFPIHTHLYTTLLTQVQIEREGSVINRSALKSNIDMLTSLTHPRNGYPVSSRPTVYKHDFEPAFLATSEEFYRAEAERLLDNNDAAQYLRHVERRFIEEEARVAVYLSSQTDRPLSRLLEKCLLSQHLKTILNMSGSGIVTMLDDDRVEDLARMYRLFWRVSEGANVMKLGLKSYVGFRGREINEQVSNTTKGGAALGSKDDEDADNSSTVRAANSGAVAGATAATASTPQAQVALKWVEDVLSFKNKFDHIWRVSFQEDKGCETSINEAFETFVNSNSRAPEFISLFIDENLKKGLKGKTEEEVEETLNRTITVFRFLHEKDVFERYYKGHLAKRLLQGRSVSDDAERGMMAKLKIECGHGYVQKLQGMLNDMKVSEETMDFFNESIQRSKKSMPFDISVNVLTSTYWPISAQSQPCTMAPSMVEARVAFERFYQSRHSGRLLTWHPNHGSADIRVQFKSKRHELNVSTYAMVILLLFEKMDAKERLSWKTIQESTGISDQELNRTLQSLACAKYKILLKEPKGREVGKEDTFAFNEGFQCNLARIKIAQIAARVETSTERKETTEKVEEERKNQVEACIVRVMKDRKTMTHNELVNEVIRQLTIRFQPTPQLVKRRIESLIDREYLERSEASMNVYNYQA